MNEEITVLTIKETAALLQISNRTIIRLVHSKELPGAFKVGGQWRFDENRLVEWLENRSPLSGQDIREL